MILDSLHNWNSKVPARFSYWIPAGMTPGYERNLLSKKLLPRIFNLIIIKVRDILRAQKFIFVCRLSINFSIKNVAYLFQRIHTSVICALHFFLIYTGGFYVQNSRYLTFTLANKNQLAPLVFIKKI